MNNGFIKRIFAFLIDIFIVNIIVGMIVAFIPTNDNVQKLNEEVLNITEQYTSGEIDDSTYLSLVYDTEYDLKKETIPNSLISLVVCLLYFVVLPFYNKGKTVGKMLNNIRVVKSNGSTLEMNDLVIRAFINNGIFISLLELVLLLCLKNHKIMVTISIMLTYMQMFILLISTIMIIFTKKKQGLHGIISKTEVVEG